ncbi:hypothetical protein LL972_06390 [Xanthomonas campestris pv. asclepiadis]|uniref:hypothetical protein n=1 Tax=Xanthomonas campestris TaxID=339 RepID=UPI001E595D2B|nr:hypothetical protein [Xanthomonas campestris]MCC4615643.1 hypothetical protein [Xanthomonas campestris pv. asclepiadis]
MKDFIQFCREIGPLACMACALGFGIGLLAGYPVGAGVAQSVSRQIERDEAIQQQCIDGNDNACRVMELRK